LLKKFEEATEKERDYLSKQVVKLDFDLKRGLAEYYDKAKTLLENSKMDLNPFEGFTPSFQTRINVETSSAEFHELESLGMEQMAQTCFVLVAGGLGEKFGYSSIKVGLSLTLLDKEL